MIGTSHASTRTCFQVTSLPGSTSIRSLVLVLETWTLDACSARQSTTLHRDAACIGYLNLYVCVHVCKRCTAFCHLGTSMASVTGQSDVDNMASVMAVPPEILQRIFWLSARSRGPGQLPHGEHEVCAPASKPMCCAHVCAAGGTLAAPISHAIRGYLSSNPLQRFCDAHDAGSAPQPTGADQCKAAGPRLF